MPITKPRAVVVTTRMPFPPSSGGQKRTLRLIEVIARSGAMPHLLALEEGEPGAAHELRNRGWTVDVIREPPPSLRSRMRQHASRRPTPDVVDLDRRLRELVHDAAFVQFEHTQNAYYWSAIGKVRSVLSTQNVDSQMLAERVRGAHGREQIRLIKDALAMRASERRAARRADIVLAVSENTTSATSNGILGTF